MPSCWPPRWGILGFSRSYCITRWRLEGVWAQHGRTGLHSPSLALSQANPRQAFDAWASKHRKPYLMSNDLKESEARFAAWRDNLEFALQYNAKGHSHWVGLNALADLTHDEYKQRYGLGAARYERVGSSAKIPGFKHGGLALSELPAAVDWREKGAVAEVKNQMSCGSCWAFSSTGSIEGVNKIETGELVSLSEQFLVDCDKGQDSGCQGGLMDYAFEFVKKHGGIELEDDYPYTGEDGECREKKGRAMRVVTIDGYQDVPELDEVALKKAASQQPISVAIEADQRAFQLYSGGVFDDKECGKELDHGVLVVGYGVAGPSEQLSEDGGPDDGSAELLKSRAYWIVKNSWGAGWGDSGYIKIRMGRGKAGLCGIASQPSFPLKTTPNPPAPPPGPKPKPGPAPGPAPPAPGPEPAPVECDSTHECPPATTCCCLGDVAGFCLSWGCCPMPKATCCKDHTHCCPESLPVCDTDAGRCLPPTGTPPGLVRSAPWATKVPATRKPAPAAALGRGRGKGARGQGAKFIGEAGLPAAS
ncbi:MAG: cysteine endopeptidase [Monoraphidium minutum]|nr:MAG: cysteine endopeptidase [Monoraphidium minutum]